MEPLVKGPAGLDYLRNAFANKYGSPSDANTSLPLTLRWLSSIWNCKDQEWEEHVNSSSALADNSSQEWLPSTTLRTGGNIMLKTTGSPMGFSPDGSNTKGSILRKLQSPILQFASKTKFFFWLKKKEVFCYIYFEADAYFDTCLCAI